MAQVKPEFILQKDTYNEKGYSSIKELSKAQQIEGSWLSTVVTHMTYSDKTFGRQNFPMLFLTEGMGNVKKVDTFDYKYNVIGKPKKTSRVLVSDYAPTDKVGLGRAKFAVTFEDKQFANQQTLIVAGGFQVRVQGEPVADRGGWKYILQVWGDSTKSILGVLFQKGVVWGGSVFKAPYEDSYGVESRSYIGGKATNMTSLVRHSHKLKGNVENKVMRFTIKADGKKFDYFVDWELYLADLAFKEQCEVDLWKSKYGRGANGEMYMIDELTGVEITSGAGIDEQIPNTDSHSFMTYRKLTQMIRDVTFNVSDAVPNIEVWTGTGGMQDIDFALKDELKGFTLVDSKQFASGGNGYDMVFGSYFKAFRHQDGALVTFRCHPMFDKGLIADIAPKHPITGLPTTSHDLYILDRSTYNGENNFQYAMEKGREYIEWNVSGSFIPKGFSKTDSRASDRDNASIHGMKSQGIQIMKPTGCYRSECLV